MTFLFLTGLIAATSLLFSLDPFIFDDAEPETSGHDDANDGGSGNGSTGGSNPVYGSDPDPMPAPDPMPDPVPDPEPTPSPGGGPNDGGGDGSQPSDIPDTGASMIDDAGTITLERGDDETGSFLAIRVIGQDAGDQDGEISETAWLDVFLLPDGTPPPVTPQQWAGTDYDTQAAALGLESIGRIPLGSATLDLDEYLATGAIPEFTDTRIAAPALVANAPITMLALEGGLADGALSVSDVRVSDTLNPVIAGEALVWQVARTPADDDWSFALSRISEGTNINGSAQADTIMLAPFEVADIMIDGGAGADRIETGVGPDVNGGSGADNIILTLPEYEPTGATGPMSEIALADSADSLGIILPHADLGPVFAVELTETSGGGAASAAEYSRVLIQSAPGFFGQPDIATLEPLLRGEAVSGWRVLAKIQLGAELITQNGDGSTSAIGIHNETPDISYAGSISGTATLTMAAAGA